jgi:hypothetical protein
LFVSDDSRASDSKGGPEWSPAAAIAGLPHLSAMSAIGRKALPALRLRGIVDANSAVGKGPGMAEARS